MSRPSLSPRVGSALRLALGAVLTYAAGGVPAGDRAALMNLYTATGGARWRNASGWGSSADPCTWAGVECSAGAAGGARVTSLWLGENNLVGSIPESIAGLTALEILCVFGTSRAHGLGHPRDIPVQWKFLH